MIRLTKELDYAIVILTFFARHGNDAIFASRAVSDETRLSHPMVSKILKILVQKGFLASHRGVKGGYSLARDAEATTVDDIIQSMEGPIGLTECTTGDHSSCKLEDFCAVTTPWQIVNRAIREKLKTISLAAMAKPSSHAPFQDELVNISRLGSS